MFNIKNRFPKKLPLLSKRKKIISDTFMKLWHQELKKFQLIENFNHNYVARSKIIPKKKLTLSKSVLVLETIYFTNNY